MKTKLVLNSIHILVIYAKDQNLIFYYNLRNQITESSDRKLMLQFQMELPLSKCLNQGRVKRLKITSEILSTILSDSVLHSVRRIDIFRFEYITYSLKSSERSRRRKGIQRRVLSDFNVPGHWENNWYQTKVGLLRNSSSLLIVQ